MRPKISQRWLLLLLCGFLLSDKAAFAQSADQPEAIGKYESGEWIRWVTVPAGSKEKFEAKATAPVEITVQDGKATQVKIMGRDNYFPDKEHGDLKYYFRENSESAVKVIAMDNGLYAVYSTLSKPLEFKNCYFPKGSKPGKPEEVIPKILAHLERMEAAYKDAQAQKAEAAAAAEAKQRELSSIKGKNVKSLRVEAVQTPSSLGHGSKIEYGVVATLADGKEIKTPNLGGTGFWDDYTITLQGGMHPSEILGKNMSHLYEGFSMAQLGAGSFFVVKNVADIPGDVVKVTASSAHHAGLEGSKEFVLSYDQAVKMQFWGGDGQDWGGERGGNAASGRNLRIEVGTVKHARTGAALLFYRFIDQKNGETITTLKLTPTAQLFVDAKGGNGGRGGKYGGNAGNGGNILVVADPSVGSYNLSTENRGGRGGSGSLGKGSDGVAGAVTKEKAKVTF